MKVMKDPTKKSLWFTKKTKPPKKKTPSKVYTLAYDSLQSELQRLYRYYSLLCGYRETYQQSDSL